MHLVHLEMVYGHALARTQRLLHLDVEVLGKVVGILNPEDSLVEIDIGGNIEVFPTVKVHDPNFFRDFLSVDEDALRDPRVLDPRLGDVDGLVSQVIVHNAGPHSEILELRLHYCLLEVTVESKHLSVELEPRGLNSGYIIVLRRFSFFLETGRALRTEGFQ